MSDRLPYVNNFFDDSTSGLPRRAQQVVLIVDNVELGIRPN
jgi:hypothetical protein